MSGNIKLRETKILCIRSGNRCAVPSCRKTLVIDGANGDSTDIIAQQAHIRGERPGSPRYDSTMTDIQRNSYDNLILLCPSCHTLIDKQPNTYTVNYLHKIKSDHEKWIIDSTNNASANITFNELNIVTKHLIDNDLSIDSSFTLIPPTDKIRKNNLSTETTKIILHGMLQAKQVSHFVECMNSIDSNFVNRLIHGFLLEYNNLKGSDINDNNIIFERLVDFSANGSSEFLQRAAGISVLVYLFEKCEVFEK